MIDLAANPVLVVAAGVAFAAAVQAVSDPRITPRWPGPRAVALVGYALHAVASIVLLAFVVPQHTPLFGPVVALAGWFGLGLLMLRRLQPEAQSRGELVRRFGVLDLAALALIAFGLATATGLI